MDRRRFFLAVLILAVFAVATQLQWVANHLPAYRNLYAQYPFYVPQSLRSVAEIALVLLTVAAMHRLGAAASLRELGLLGTPFRGIAFAVVATLPLWLVFSLTMPVASATDPWKVAYLAGLSPLAEEVVFRAFAFGQLRRRLGWSFRAAALVPAVVFGLEHLRANQSLGEMVGVFLITGLGALLFSLVYERRRYDLWAVWALHASMNLSWNVFIVGDSAFSGWLPTTMQLTTALVAIALVLWRPDTYRHPAETPR